MPLPPIKLVWSPRRQPADWRWGGLLGSYRRGGGGSWAVAVSVRGVLLWGGTLGLAALLATAGAATLWLDRKPSNRITYADLVLPWHWPQLNRLRGESQIEEGVADLREKKYGPALLSLEAGLRRFPASPRGRVELAQVHLLYGHRQQAEQTLLAGLAQGYPGRTYLARLFAIAAADENFPLWLQACDMVLAAPAGRPVPAADRQLVVRQKLSALLAAGRADEAVRLAEAEGESQGPVMREFKVVALLKAGQPAAAVDFLAQVRARPLPPAELAETLMLQVRAFREAGRPDDMDHALDELRASDPATPTPYIYAIVQRLLAGRRAEAEKSFDAFFLRFGTNLQVLVVLAEPLAEIGEEPLLNKLIVTASAQRLSPLPLQRALVAAQIKNGHWADADATLALMAPALPKDDLAGQFWLEWMAHVVAAARSPAPDVQAGFVNFLRDRRPALALYREALTTLRLAGRAETAQRVLALASGAFPDSVFLRDQAEGIAQEVARAVAARPAFTPTAPAVVGEAELFRTLADPLQTADPAAALGQIRAVRAANPAWLAARDDELRRDEVILAARLHDATALTTAAGLWLNGDNARALAAVELAKQLHAAGVAAEAGLLLDAVLRKTPGYAAATRLLAEWRPAATTPTPATAAVPVLTAAVIASEPRFLQALADTMQAGDSAAALGQIRAARVAHPAWLAARDAELSQDEILLNGRLGETLAMSAAARLYLNGDTARTSAAIALAQQLHDGGHPAEAVRLLQDVLRKTPNLGFATRLLGEWEPPATP